MSEPYRDTSVSVEKSKEQIRKALRGASDPFQHDGRANDYFASRPSTPEESKQLLRERHGGRPSKRDGLRAWIRRLLA